MDDDIFNALNWDSYLLADKLNIKAVYKGGVDHRNSGVDHRNSRSNESQRDSRSNESQRDNQVQEYERTALNKQVQDELQNARREYFTGSFLHGGKSNGGCADGVKCSKSTCQCSKCSKSTCQCGKCKKEGMDNIHSDVQCDTRQLDHTLFINKMLMVFVFILSTVCIMQAIHQKNVSKMLMQMMPAANVSVVPNTTLTPNI